MNLWQGLIDRGFTALIIGDGDLGGAAAEAANGAQEAAAGGLFGGMGGILIWVLMFAALYFFLIRPSRKRDKAQKEMQSALKVGDRVLTNAGFYGKIVDVGTDAFVIEFGENRGIRVPVQKGAVVGVRSPNMAPPGREALEDKSDDKDKDKKEDKKD